eukprot:430154-Amphidinium_carterae.1
MCANISPWRLVFCGEDGLAGGFALPQLAKKVNNISGSLVDEGILQLSGLLLASIILPAMVTVASHTKCLSAWTRFWEVCTVSGFSFGSHE